MKYHLNKFLLFHVAISLFICSSCSKSADCFDSLGETKKEVITIEMFESVTVDDNIQIILNNKADLKITKEGPSNILNDFIIEQNGTNLSLKNINACGWSKKPYILKAYIPSQYIKNIDSKSLASIVSEEPLNNFNARIFYDGATGNSNIELNGGSISIQNLSFENITLSGQCDQLNFNMGINDGLLNSKDLKTKSTTICHSGYNDLFLGETEVLNVTLKNDGNVFYTGNPMITLKINSGTGKLQKIN